MRHLYDYKRIIAVKEMSAGNETVGDMWIETKSFDRDTKVSEILDWAENCKGRLIITMDESK